MKKVDTIMESIAALNNVVLANEASLNELINKIRAFENETEQKRKEMRAEMSEIRRAIHNTTKIISEISDDLTLLDIIESKEESGVVKEMCFRTGGVGEGRQWEEKIEKAKADGTKLVIMSCDCYWNQTEWKLDDGTMIVQDDYSKAEFFRRNPANTFRFSFEKPITEVKEALEVIKNNQWAVIVTYQCGPCEKLVEALKERGFTWEKGGD